jgi:hypothetical protein
MSKFYVVDSTINKGGKNPVMLFDNTPTLVGYLEKMCQRKFGKSRSQYMNDSESLGFGGDENTGKAFFDQMEQYFNMGVIRNDSTPVKCNIFDADRFSKVKSVHGN